MFDVALISGWETALVAIPFFILLAVGMFRLDELMVAPKRSAKPRRPPAGTDEDGQAFSSDPDGKPWEKPRARK